MIPAGMIRLKKNRQKMKSALLPIATKSGTQEVDSFSQLQGCWRRISSDGLSSSENQTDLDHQPTK